MIPLAVVGITYNIIVIGIALFMLLSGFTPTYAPMIFGGLAFLVLLCEIYLYKIEKEMM